MKFENLVGKLLKLKSFNSWKVFIEVDQLFSFFHHLKAKNAPQRHQTNQKFLVDLSNQNCSIFFSFFIMNFWKKWVIPKKYRDRQNRGYLDNLEILLELLKSLNASFR